MTELVELNEAELDRNLRTYHANDGCYCYCGNTLVAVNPFKNIPGLYDNRDSFTGISERELRDKPHMFAIAELAFQKCFMDKKNGGGKQALVITGESGAGKTWNTKKALSYLATVGKCPAKGGRAPVTERMVNSNVILDMFGNATMPRNDDSSRFGKLFQVFFDRSSKQITGAQITPYLLEKGRLIHQAHRERNFHVFYGLLAGADASLKSKLHLLERHQYRYLNRFIPAAPQKFDLGKEYKSDSDADRLLYEVCTPNSNVTLNPEP